MSITVDGWRLGLAVCKDTGIDEHTDAVSDLDVDLYVAGVVHHDSELTEQQRRVRRIAARTNAYVLLASCAGSTGEGYARTAGHSVVWDPDHGRLAGVDGEPGEIARAVLAPR